MKQTKYSLYSALGLIVVTVVVSVVTIYSTVSYFYSKNAIVEEMESRSETSIVFLRQDLAHHIEAYAINEYEILISNEMDASDFFAIVVTDYNMGEIIGQDGYVTGKIRDADWNIADYDPENSEQNGALERCYYSDTDIIVSESGERLGTISICSSDRSLQQELEDTIFRNVIYTFSISLFLILLLFFMIRRVVIRPVSEIVNGLLAIDESGLPREKVATLGPPEIRILGTSINSMIDAVHMRETELLQSEERIRLLLDSTAEGIYGLDLEGNCTFANKMCLKLTGYQDVDELIGKNMHELIHHTHNDGSPYPVEKCHIYRAFKEGRGTHVDSEVFWRSDGTSFSVEYSSFPIRENGEVIGSVLTFSDITEKRQAESSMQTLVASTAEHVGDDFFKAAVESLYHWIDADVVILSELTDSQKFRAIA